jgi:para-aminobenzoate synthetase/4-amino-4-deoxychorismate lyase
MGPGGSPRGDGAPRARFDDVPGGESCELEQFERAIEARRPEDVLPALAAAEQAAAAGAWVGGFVSYDAAAGLDGGLATPAGRDGAAAVPLVWFGVFAARRRTAPLDDPPPSACPPEWALDLPADRHAARVAAVRGHIAAGDVYQCNLTARYRATTAGDPFDLYRRMVAAQRSAHCAFIDTGRLAVLSASPELFFEWRDDAVVTRPMKGTARRGRWPEEDRRLAEHLLASDKDRAENVMIVDLLRNDLGKVAAYGTVSVPALCQLERYQTVWQLTSTVTARVAPRTTLVDLFCALFPSGSVTGAPKRRAMEVIASLEDTPRGVYCGAIGFIAPPDARRRARFSVAIRTAVVDRATGRSEYGSGGGIVWDSEPQAEYAELVAKARVLGAVPGDFTLLETMLALPGRVARWPRHRTRLLASADYFGFDVDGAAVDRAVHDAATGVGVPSRMRLSVTRRGAITVALDVLDPAPVAPVRVELDATPVDTGDPWLFHKTSRREVYEARAARHPAADQVLLVNDLGDITETTVANVAVQLGDRWWTPPLESGCLPGVLRAELLEQGQLTERRIAAAELEQASALAVLSSLRGWRRAEWHPRAPA